MSREDKKRDKKNRLLDAARRSFAEKGFRKTTVDEIVDRAQVAKGTFYLYFKNKESVFKELVELLERRYKSLREKMRQEKDLEDKLYFFAKGYFSLLEDNRDLARIGLFNFDHVDESLKKFFIRLQTFQVDSIKEEIIAAGFILEEPRKAALAFVGMVNYFAAHYVLNPDRPFSPEKDARFVVDLFFKGIPVK